MTFYIKHPENLVRFIFDSLLTCNVLKINSSVPMEDLAKSRRIPLENTFLCRKAVKSVE